MNYWLYGGFGSIGSSLTKSYDFGNNEIFISGRDSIVERRFYCPKSSKRKIEEINKDIFYKKFINTIDVCLYLACPIFPSSKVLSKDLNKFFQSEIIQIEKVLEGLSQSKNCFIYFSSGGAIYDDSINKFQKPFTEDSFLAPRSVYGKLKIRTEDFLTNFSQKKTKTSIYSARLANPYGIIRRDGKEQGVIPIYRDNITLNKSVYKYGDGSQVRDYIHIEDVVKAIDKIINYKGRFHTFNIGTGIGTSLSQLIMIIESLLKLKADIIELPERDTDMRYSVLDCNRALKELDWAPLIKLKQGLLKTFNI